MTKQKLIGLLLIIVGIPFGITALDRTLPSSYFVAAGMLMIFFSPERINDERVQQLKMKALFTAMGAGLGLTFFAYSLMVSLFRGLGPSPQTLHHAVSAWDFLAGILVFSLGLFHYWRWRDAQPGHDG